MKPMDICRGFTIALLLLAAACNTFEGVGKDVEKAGQAIKGSASEVRGKMK